MRAIIVVLLLAFVSGPALAAKAMGTGLDPKFEKAVARIRAAFEADKHLPLDRDLYIDNLLVTHNYDPGGPVDTTAFLTNTGKELEAAKRVGISQKSELTRFLVADDTVVATVLNTGASADGKPTRFNIAYFFTIKDGKVTHIETWYDRKGSDDQLQSLGKEMKK